MKYLPEIIKDVKSKKELRNIDDDFIEEKILLFLKKYPETTEKINISLSYKQFKKSKEYEILFKEIRKRLRENYGVFIKNNYDEKENMLEELRKNPSRENYKSILKMHQSTLERLPYYEEIYKKIFKITGNPKSILDLGCGLNPFSYIFLGCSPKYIASDLNENDCGFIKKYFNYLKINGTVIKKNLLEVNEKLPKTDIVFLFKLIDVLENNKRNITEKLLENINSKFIVISFPRVSLGGKKPISREKRKWFENLALRKKYRLDYFEIPNESFYILKKTI